MILPWVLYIILNGDVEVLTPIRYASYDECMTKGALVALSIKIDLMLANHTLEPKCVLK